MSLRNPAAIFLAALTLTGFSTGQTLYSVDTLAGSDNVGDGGPAADALLTHLQGIACDAAGNVYIADADDHRVRKITPDGNISTVAGTGHAGFSGDGGPASAARLNTPYGLAVDRSGNLYIADLGNRRVRRVDTEGRILTIAGGGAKSAAEADGLPAIDASLDSPRNVLPDGYGGVYFSDFGANRVYYISPSGTLLHIAGTGEAGFSGDRGGALFAKLSAPAGLAIDSLGALYIADAGNGRVRRVFHGIIETFGDTGDPKTGVLVTPTLPTGLAFDPDGALYHCARRRHRGVARNCRWRGQRDSDGSSRRCGGTGRGPVRDCRFGGLSLISRRRPCDARRKRPVPSSRRRRRSAQSTLQPADSGSSRCRGQHVHRRYREQSHPQSLGRPYGYDDRGRRSGRVPQCAFRRRREQRREPLFCRYWQSIACGKSTPEESSGRSRERETPDTQATAGQQPVRD